MTINRIGASLVGGGIAAIGLSLFFGAGPCNATTLGIAFMLLGYAAVSGGLIVLAIAHIVRSIKGTKLHSN